MNNNKGSNNLGDRSPTVRSPKNGLLQQQETSDEGLSANGSQLRLHPRRDSRLMARMSVSQPVQQPAIKGAVKIGNNVGSQAQQQNQMAQANADAAVDQSYERMVQAVHKNIMAGSTQVDFAFVADKQQLNQPPQIEFEQQKPSQVLLFEEEEPHQLTKQLVQTPTQAAATTAFADPRKEFRNGTLRKESHDQLSPTTFKAYSTQKLDADDFSVLQAKHPGIVLEQQTTQHQMDQDEAAEMDSDHQMQQTSSNTTSHRQQQQLLQQQRANLNHHNHQKQSHQHQQNQVKQMTEFRPIIPKQIIVEPTQQPMSMANQYQLQSNRTNLSTSNRMNSGAIIFEVNRRFSDTKKLPKGRVLSPNHMSSLRFQQRAAGAINTQPSNDIFSQSRIAKAAVNYKHGVRGQSFVDSDGLSSGRLNSASKPQSGPPLFQPRQRSSHSPFIALQRSHQRMHALEKKQMQVQINQSMQMQNSMTSRGKANVSIMSKQYGADQAGKKKRKSLPAARPFLLKKTKTNLVSQNASSHCLNSTDSSPTVVLSSNRHPREGYAIGKDGTMKLHQNAGMASAIDENVTQSNDDLPEVRQLGDTYDVDAQGADEAKLGGRSSSQSKRVLVSGKSSSMMAVVNNESVTVLESNPSAISHMAMQPVAIQSRDPRTSSQQRINARRQLQQSASKSRSTANQTHASVVDLNQMTAKQLPVRSTSQMENMVNLGGSYRMSLGENIDLTEADKEQIMLLKQQKERQKSIEHLGGSLQQQLAKIDSSPQFLRKDNNLVAMAVGGEAHQHQLSQFNVNSGAFVLQHQPSQQLKQILTTHESATMMGATNKESSDQLLMHQLSKIKQASSLKRLISAQHPASTAQSVKPQQAARLGPNRGYSVNAGVSKAGVHANNHNNENRLNYSRTVDNQIFQQQPKPHRNTAASTFYQNNRFKDRLLSYQGNYRASLGATTNFSHVHSPNSADISCVDVDGDATGGNKNLQLAAVCTSDQAPNGSKFYMFGSENKDSSEKVIVRVKPSPRPLSKEKAKQIPGPKYPVRHRTIRDNNRRGLHMKVGSLSTQSDCNFRDMLLVSQELNPNHSNVFQQNLLLQALSENQQEMSAGQSKVSLGSPLNAANSNQASHNVLIGSPSASQTQDLRQSFVDFQQLQQPSDVQEQEQAQTGSFKYWFKKHEQTSRNFIKSKSQTQRQKRIQQQYDRRQALNLQTDMQRKFTYQQRLVVKQHEIELEKQEILRQAIQASNSQVMDYSNLVPTKLDEPSQRIALHVRKPDLLHVDDSTSSPLKVITEDNGSSVAMAPNNLAARKSSAIHSGTQNLSEMQHPSLVHDQNSERGNADLPSKIVIIKPPGVEFKRKQSMEGFVDYNDKNFMKMHFNASSEANFSKRGSGPGPGHDVRGRIHSMSMKGIRWGNNQSIDVNTDKLLLTTSGQDPNIISYRKAINSNASSNINSQTQQRLASAKISSGNPAEKLVIDTQPKLEVKVEMDRVEDDCAPGGEASPNTIYKSTAFDHSLKDTYHLNETELRGHESAIRNSSIINLKQLDMTPSRSFQVRATKFTQQRQTKVNSSIEQEPSSTDLTPVGADLRLRRREGSAISPGIDALLESKYQGRGGHLHVGDASSSNHSAIGGGKMHPLQASTQLKHMSMTQVNGTPVKCSPAPASSTLVKNSLQKRYSNKASPNIGPTDGSLKTSTMHLQQNQKGHKSTVEMLRTNSKRSSHSGNRFGSHKILGEDNTGSQQHQLPPAVIHSLGNSSMASGLGQQAQQQQLQHQSKGMKTERQKPAASGMDLKPMVTPLSLVEVSVKKGRVPASGQLSRQAGTNINSSRNNQNDGKTMTSKVVQKSTTNNSQSKTSRKKASSSAINSATMQHIFLRDRYEGSKDVNSAMEELNKEIVHTLVQTKHQESTVLQK